MNREPDPRQATEALRDVDRRTTQAIGSLSEVPRRLDVLAGLVLLAHGMVPDLAPGAAVWSNTVFALLVVGYVAMGRTRRGTALLGQPTRVDREALSPRFTRTAVITIATFFAASLIATVVLSATRTTTHIPYLSTALGAFCAILLIGFGWPLRNGLARLAGAGRPAAEPGHDH